MHIKFTCVILIFQMSNFRHVGTQPDLQTIRWTGARLMAARLTVKAEVKSFVILEYIKKNCDWIICIWWPQFSTGQGAVFAVCNMCNTIRGANQYSVIKIEEHIVKYIFKFSFEKIVKFSVIKNMVARTTCMMRSLSDQLNKKKCWIFNLFLMIFLMFKMW